MIKKSKVSLILPCRNEENALKALFKVIPKFIDEVIVVDNMSTDKTVEVARRNKARVFIEPRNFKGIGYGYALAMGIKQAKGDILICMDGDGSYPVKKIHQIVNHLNKTGLDFISCNRIPVQDPKKMSFIRVLGVNILNILVRVLFRYPIKDSLTGMWVFKRKVIPSLTLFEGGWDFSLEIKLSAIASKAIKFDEFYIPYHDRIFDQSKQNLFKTGFNHSMYILRRRFINARFLFNPSLRVSLLEN